MLAPAYSNSGSNSPRGPDPQLGPKPCPEEQRQE
jgi:hypothetical protein